MKTTVQIWVFILGTLIFSCNNDEPSGRLRHCAQQNVCAMVGWRVSSKCYLRSTFAHADSGGFESPPLRKHKRCVLF